MIAFEGCLGAGKTTLTNYFGKKTGAPRLLEEFHRNPFLEEFYAFRAGAEGARNVVLETEMAFLLLHYSQLRGFAPDAAAGPTFADFCIEKDLVYTQLGLQDGLLTEQDVKAFLHAYEHVTKGIPAPSHVVYLDASPDVIQRRIFQRGRPYELDADPQYIKDYADRVKSYFVNESKTPTKVFNVDDLVMEEENEALARIEDHLRSIGIDGV